MMIIKSKLFQQKKTHASWWLSLFFLVLYLFLHLALGKPYLLAYPAIWPDESIYAHMTEFIDGTPTQINLLKFVPNAEKLLLGSQPWFFYILSFWTKIFIPGIFSQRLLSFIIGGMCLVLLDMLMCLVVGQKQHYVRAIFLITLMTDVLFFQIVRMSRPEIIVLFFACLTLVAYIYFLKKKITHPLSYIFIGITSGATFLVHALGIYVFSTVVLHQISIHKTGILKQKGWYWLGIGFLIPIFLTFFDSRMMENVHYLINVIPIRNSTMHSWLWWVFAKQPLLEKLRFSLYIGASILVVFTMFRINVITKLFSCLLLMIWLMVLVGKTQWHFVYPIPFLYLGLAISVFHKGIFQRLGKILLIGVFTLNIFILFFITFSRADESYISQAKIKEITSHILPASAVLLSSIPDAYFDIKEVRPDLKLYEFPYLITDATGSDKKFLTLMSDVDYVLYNVAPPHTESLFEAYIKLNKQEVFQLKLNRNTPIILVGLNQKSDRKTEW